jgi:hypothetical protein
MSCCQKALTVWAKDHAMDHVRVWQGPPQLDSSISVPDSYYLIFPCGGHDLTIEADRQGGDLVAVLERNSNHPPPLAEVEEAGRVLGFHQHAIPLCADG